MEYQDGTQVPLVWQRGDNPNVIGDFVLENRDDGVYVHGRLNDTEVKKRRNNNGV